MGWPINWDINSIGNLFQTMTGSTPPKSQIDNYGSDIPFVKPPELQDAEISKTADNLSVKGATKSRILPSGSVLVSCIGNLGKTGINQQPVSFNQQINAICPDDSFVSEFMFYQAQSPWFKLQLDALASGTTVPIVNKSKFNSIKVALPPIPEQKRIVAILGQVFADIEQARAKTEQNLRNARELFESYLQQVFSQRGEEWVEERLESLCTFSSGGTPSKKNNSYWSGNIPWVSGRDMKSTQLSDSFLHISQSAVDESSTRMAPAGSILALVRGMGLAHGAQIAELMVPCAYNQDIRGIHPKPNMVSRYLVFALRHQINSSDNVLSSAAHGTLKINMDELKNIVIPVPPTDQQEHIVDSFNVLIKKVDRLESFYQKKLIAIDELKKSILHLAFSGKLTRNKTKGAAA